MAQRKIKICTGCGRLDTEPLGLNKNGEPYLACCPDNSYKPVTALEWLVSKIWKTEPLEHEKEVIEQAKQMERKQIIESRITAPLLPTPDKDPYLKEAEQYYNDTYESNP